MLSADEEKFVDKNMGVHGVSITQMLIVITLSRYLEKDLGEVAQETKIIAQDIRARFRAKAGVPE